MYDATYTTVEGDTIDKIMSDKGLSYRQITLFNEGTKQSDGTVLYWQTSPPGRNEELKAGLVLKLYGNGVSLNTDTMTSDHRVTMLMFDRLQGSDRTIVASWIYNEDVEFVETVLDHYTIEWDYYVTGATQGDSTWLKGDRSDVTETTSTYNAPSTASMVRFRAKPVSKQKGITGNSTADSLINNSTIGQLANSAGIINSQYYFTADFIDYYTFVFDEDKPSAPTGLNVKLQDYKLTASLSGIDSNIANVQFRYTVDNNKNNIADSTWVEVNSAYAAYTWTVIPGHLYKVQARLENNSNRYKSEWSDYSDNYSSGPSASAGITSIQAISDTSVELEWAPATNAETYEVQYTDNVVYFDASTEVHSISVKTPHQIVSGLTSGKEWFFRVRAVSDGTNSTWTFTKSVKVGTVPIAPTTWSSTVTAQVGEDVTLYWVHNSEDGSTETTANLSITIGESTTTKTVTNTNGDATSFYTVSTSGYTEGTTITWKVQTKGILADYGPWSAERTITVYAPPTVSLALKDSSDTQISTITSYPLKITGEAGPNTQTPIGYHLSIVSTDAYLTTDDMGNYKMINAGDEVFSKYYNSNSSFFSESLSANNVNLDNGHSYTVILTVAMNSGLTGTSEATFNTSWSETLFTPNAEVAVDRLNMSAYIKPYCKDDTNTLLPNYKLSVYRREYDGTFTEIITGLNNTDESFVTDPHPSLDYARYRIVAMNEKTGTVTFYDAPGVYFGITSVIMQWDEQWRDFDLNAESIPAEPTHTGSMLFLNYNIDVADDYETDSSLVKYIGRDYPVSYYGTQKGMTSTWDVEIPKTDKDTLYAIRRLAIWMGDVYVREPSGTGYWARVSVSYNTRHRELTIPVSFRITRVEGGK
jgi:hypothetical protein